MTVRVYLRASTKGQDALRAKQYIKDEAEKQGLSLTDAFYYTEIYSGRIARRPELERLLQESNHGDIILIEQIDRLTRLTSDGWKQLKLAIESKGVKIVACDVPTSFTVLEESDDEIQQRILESVNALLIDILAATASKDYEDRRRRQAEGIAANKDKFKGRKANPQTAENCKRVHQSLEAKIATLDELLNTYSVGRATYYRWKKEHLVSVQS